MFSLLVQLLAFCDTSKNLLWEEKTSPGYLYGIACIPVWEEAFYARTRR